MFPYRSRAVIDFRDQKIGFLCHLVFPARLSLILIRRVLRRDGLGHQTWLPVCTLRTLKY